MMSRWRTLGEVAPTRLVASRETVHHAAQLVALAGASFLTPERDDSHTSMTWLADLGALASQPIRAERTVRFGVRIADLTLLLIEEATLGETASFALHGRTRDDALQWMRTEATRAGLDGSRLRSRLHFTIADHVTDHGGAFARPDDGTFEELASWYGDASLVLEQRRAAMAGTGPVRCWPHHFDIATLVRLSGGPIETIGIGLSPGDDSYAEPYYYVSPSPAPTETPRPLSIGSWHTSEWWGAVLEGSRIVEEHNGNAQAALIERFVDAALTQVSVRPSE